MATVNIEAVNKYYDGNAILNNINLKIEKGEFVALVGPSGSGKSTLLRLVAGLDSVCNGRILINEQCVNTIPASQRNMAMVFQNYALYPHMTVFANMAYGLKMRGMNKKLIKQHVEKVSELLQIKPYLYRKPMALSGGQRQRVAMGRAIVRDPAVFLFDEPLSNLDSKLRTEMRHEIKKLHQKLNTTCLYVTHDQTEAMTLADRIVILKNGCIEQVGTPQELYQTPETMFVASFIGHYAMNFIPGKIDHKSQSICTNVGLILPKPQIENNDLIDDVMIGIRPEHLSFANDETEHIIKAQVDFIDDMGADKLLQMTTIPGDTRLSVRIFDNIIKNNEHYSLAIDLKKVNLFCSKTGNRIGGWFE